MWDLIVSVPDHCLSLYFSNPRTRDPKSGALTARPRGRFGNRVEKKEKSEEILSNLI